MRTLESRVLQTLELTAERSDENEPAWMSIAEVTQYVMNSRRVNVQRQIAARLRGLERRGLIERRRFGRGYVGWRLRVDK